MEATLATAVATAGIKLLVEKLMDVLKNEYSRLFRSLKGDLQNLQKTLRMIEAYLSDADNKSITQQLVKIWLSDLEDFAFDADNVLDELNYHLLRKKIMKSKIYEVPFSPVYSILRKHKMARAIKKINANFESMSKRAADLGIQSMVANATAAAPVSFETDSFSHDPVFIGRDDDVTILVDMLTQTGQTHPEEEKRKFSIVALVGMGGMGKTTLTKKVFNHERVKARFGSLVIWVHVSQTFTPIILFKQILSALPSHGGGDEGHSREVILRKLREALEAKTYLLVLDDVWNEDAKEWDDFMNSMSGVTSTVANGIIITTRSQKVASIVNPLEYTLRGLSNNDCWSIIKEKAFDGKGEVPPEFEKIGKEIAKRCGGLPLAANVVGCVLRRKPQEEWRRINEKGLSHVEGDENINKILKLSFDHLSSSSLKKCFAYCSVFPKGEKIVKQELIELWMGEEFLQLNQGDDMEFVGNVFFNVLLQNSLLQVAERNRRGDVVSYVMHDLVHDLASSVLSNNADGSTPVRYMFLKEESSSIPKEVAKHVRTLFFKGDPSHAMLSNFKSLHNLILYGQRFMELPNSIKELIHLRYLNISHTSIKNLPEWIGELHHLQTIRGDWYLEKLPSTLKHLINLRHIYMPCCPAEIGRLTSLQTAPMFTVAKEKGCRIEELGSLKNLKGKLMIRHLERVCDKEEALKANMLEKPNLSELVFEWDEGNSDERNDESVLEGLQPLANLKKLRIKGYKGKKFPRWIEKMEVWDGCSWLPLHSLIEIILHECSECEEILKGHLPNLKTLALRGLKKVRVINFSFANSLSYLNTLHSLETLVISDCPNLESIGNPNLPNLKRLYLDRLKWVTIMNATYDHLTSLELTGLEELECLPERLFYNNLNLSELYISECGMLSALPDGLDNLNSLEELTIKDCPNLKSIGNPSGRAEQYQGIIRILSVIGCGELIELPHQMLELWAPTIRHLELIGLKSLKNLPMLIDCIAKSSSIGELIIRGVPKLMAASNVESWALGLDRLEIDVSEEWSRKNYAAINNTVNGILQRSKYLQDMKLKGVEDWEWLPESMQHNYWLGSLVLENIGVEELPQWFVKLLHLYTLSLHGCKKLKCLPSVNAFKYIRKLEIIDCPKLRIDLEWRNRPNLEITVDGSRIHGRWQPHLNLMASLGSVLKKRASSQK